MARTRTEAYASLLLGSASSSARTVGHDTMVKSTMTALYGRARPSRFSSGNMLFTRNKKIVDEYLVKFMVDTSAFASFNERS